MTTSLAWKRRFVIRVSPFSFPRIESVGVATIRAMATMLRTVPDGGHVPPDMILFVIRIVPFSVVKCSSLYLKLFRMGKLDNLG